jgi:hypothetical protein
MYLSLFDKCKGTSKVSFFLRLWKLWLHLGTHTYSLKTNFISRQAYLDMQISCHCIVLLIKLFKDKYNHLEVPFGLLGSDVCEIFFSKVGGMISNERNYDGIDLVESAGALARIAEFEADPTGPRFLRAHKKQTHIWNELEKNSTLEAADLRDYSCVENDDLIVLALKLGFQEAQEMCAELGMKPDVVRDGSWWVEPWIHEKKIEAHLFGSMEEDECDYDHILIDDPITHGGEKEDCGVEGGNSNSSKDAFIEAEGLQSLA